MAPTAFKQVKNNAVSAVAAGSTIIASTSGTAITLTTGQGARFPQPGNGFWVTVWDAATFASPSDDANMEIMLVTARSTDVLTVTRAQLGTTAKATHTAGFRVQLLIQDQQLTDVHTAVNAIEDPGAWTSYTPTWTGSVTNPAIGNGTLVGYWHRIGRTIHGRINLMLGTTSTVGSGSWAFGLPVAASANVLAQTFVGSVYVEDAGTFAYEADLQINNSTSLLAQLRIVSGAWVSLSTVGAASPMAWGNGDFLRGSFFYEAAS